MVRPPNGFNTGPIATALPSDQRAAPWQPTGLPTLSSSSSLGNQPTTAAAPATASAPLNLPRQLLLTLNQFRFIFDSLAGGGEGGGNRGVQGMRMWDLRMLWGAQLPHKMKSASKIAGGECGAEKLNLWRNLSLNRTTTVSPR